MISLAFSLANTQGITAVELSEDEWHLVFDVNVKSFFLTAKHVLPVMEKQGKGAIVNVSSIASIRSPKGVSYIVTRFRSGVATLLDVVATLPFAVAGTVLAIGFIVSFNSGMLVLTGGPLIMVLAYTVRKVPFAVRSASAIVHQIDASLEEASISLGCSPLETFLRIVVPLMLGGILSGVVLTWVTVASELSATVVLYSGPWRTMTVVMFQALEGSGAGIATAAASTLIVVTLLPIVLLYRLVRRYELSML